MDFLSKATLTGFMGGAAVIVSLQQLKGLLGISHFTSHMGFLDVMRSVVNRHDEVRACPCCALSSPAGAGNDRAAILSASAIEFPVTLTPTIDACSGSGRRSSWAPPSSPSSSSRAKS